MNRCVIQFSAIVLLPLATMTSSGCTPSGLASVSGSVMYKGKPATGASVHFHRDGETPEEATNFPIGMVDEEGNFELETQGVGWGAVPGKYNVLIHWPEMPQVTPTGDAISNVKARRTKKSAAVVPHRKDPESVKDRLGFRYFNRQKPLLTAEVMPGSNKLDPFEIKD